MIDHNSRAFGEALLHERFLINVNNLVSAPSRTGIQRVCYEFCTRWPYIENTVPFVELGPDRIGILTPDIFEDIRKLFEQDDPVLGAVQANNPSLKIEPNAGWMGLISARNRIAFEVSAEIALDACRAVISLEESLNLDFYSFAAKYRPEKIFNLCHDFLVWTHAQHFNVKWDHADNILLSVENRRKYRNNFFTSTAMREQYVSRINRGDEREYFVIPPGADGLGRTYRQAVPASNEFVVVGTLEPRKQPIQILEAFEQLNAGGHVASLCFAGRMGWLAAEDKRRLLKAFEDYSWVRWVDGPDDEVLRSLMQHSRATIYLSLAEGFGSPPVESLALGVPCIVSATIPSVLDMPSNGQVRIAPEDGAALMNAVRRLLDDDALLALQKEIETLPLPRWQGFVDSIAAMIDERAPLGSGQQVLSYSQSLDVLLALSQMRELPRDSLIAVLMKAACSDVRPLQIARMQDEAKAEHWTNVDVVQNLAARMPTGTIPAAFVQGAVRDTLDAARLRPAQWRLWQAGFRDLCREPDYRLFIERIFSEIHGRSVGDSELEAHLPAHEVSQTRLRALMEALDSGEYGDRQAQLIHERAPSGYFDRVSVSSAVWKKAAVASLANEAAVDRALLIESDASFVQTASLDLMAQLPSVEQAKLWRDWAGSLRGRYRVLLDILTSRACLLKVSDPRVHFELIHDVARHAGLGGRQKMTSLQLANRVAKAMGDARSSDVVSLSLLADDGDIGRDYGVDRLIKAKTERGQAIALAALWMMASGRAEWNGRLLNWASSQLKKVFVEKTPGPFVETGAGADQFRAAIGRPATPEELSVLSKLMDEREGRIGRLAIFLSGLRRGELADFVAAMRAISEEAPLVIAEADAIENLSSALDVAAPRRFGRALRVGESGARSTAEASGDRGEAREPEMHRQPHADGDISSVEQLLALEGETFVRMGYKKILLREADSGGLTTYLKLLRSDNGKAAVIRELALSEEGRSKNTQMLGLQDFLEENAVRAPKRRKGWKRLFRFKR